MPTQLKTATEPLTDPYLDGFTNEIFIDFSDPEDRRRMEETLEKVRSELGATYPLVIGDEETTEGDTWSSTNPARPSEVVGSFPKATKESVEKSVQAATEAFDSWSARSAEERSEICMRAKEIARDRRFELAAWMVFEVGKSWVEAYGDIAEAIDFYDFYARQNLRLDAPQPLVDQPGEELELRYIPLGVGAVIPPWNFPYAITAGMTIAAVVTGNTVVLKPSSDAPVTAYQFFKIWQEAGLPPGVVNFMPGSGRVVGAGLVEHAKVRFIAFTGSKDVGLFISEESGKTRPDQLWIKRTVLEMGGKDAIVVDSEADLDSAVEGVVLSAFGYQGQKCSACSRAIVDESLYEEFLEKVAARTQQITVGPTDGSVDTFMGPVINEAAYNDILEYIDVGGKEGRLITGGNKIETKDSGYFIEPTIFADIDPEARLAQEEIFGPVLAVIKAKDYDDALRIANNTEYGLTGAVYSQNRDKIDEAKRRFHVGNLYVNRKCTGAMVGGHPFGGFNMSGTDSKTGGRDYLLLFTQAKSIAEKVS